MKKYLVEIDGIDSRELDSLNSSVEICKVDENNSYHILLDGKGFLLHLISFSEDRKTLEVSINGARHTLQLKNSFDQFIDEFRALHQVESWTEYLHAPMPGKIIEILVSPGQAVQKGEKLLILEAMKMENIISAPDDEVIAEVLFNVGDTIQKNDNLIRFQNKEIISPSA